MKTRQQQTPFTLGLGYRKGRILQLDYPSATWKGKDLGNYTRPQPVMLRDCDTWHCIFNTWPLWFVTATDTHKAEWLPDGFIFKRLWVCDTEERCHIVKFNLKACQQFKHVYEHMQPPWFFHSKKVENNASEYTVYKSGNNYLVTLHYIVHDPIWYDIRTGIEWHVRGQLQQLPKSLTSMIKVDLSGSVTSVNEPLMKYIQRKAGGLK